VADGSYVYNLSVVPGESPKVPVGTLSIKRATTVVVTFAPTEYKVTFTETGLKAKQAWRVTVGTKAIASTHTSITFDLANGTYAYAIKGIAGKNVTVWDPAMGSDSSWKGTLVVQGQPENLSATFTTVYYVASFTASSLPTGASWSIVIRGTTYSSTSSSINVSLPNGTYRYRVVPPTEFKATPSTALMKLKGAGKNITIDLTPLPSDPAGPSVSLPSLTTLVDQLLRLV
jgi:hypothetical protein